MRAVVLLLSTVFLSGVLAVEQQGGPPPAPVRVAPVVEREVNLTVDLTGTAEPHRRSTVATQVAGVVEELFFDVGDSVKDKAPLVRLDTDELTLLIEASEATKGETQARHDLAQGRLKRSAELHKKGRISDEELADDKQEAAALAARLKREDAVLRRLKNRLEKAAVSAPFKGEVTKKHTEKGEWLAAGGSVAEIVDLSLVRVVLDMPERYRARLQIKAEVVVRADALPGVPLKGKIHSVVPEADPDSRTVPVRVEIANETGRIHSGMFLRATLTLDKKRTALLVPKDAVVQQGPMSFVYAVVDGKANQIPVRRGGSYGGDVEIDGPLKPGMKVVIRGNERLRPGQPVRILPDEKK